MCVRERKRERDRRNIYQFYYHVRSVMKERTVCDIYQIEIYKYVRINRKIYFLNMQL